MKEPNAPPAAVGLPRLPLSSSADAHAASLPSPFRSISSYRSPRPTTRLPYFKSSNVSPLNSNFNKRGGRCEPQDITPMTALERSLERLRATKTQIWSCLDRMNQAEQLFEKEQHEMSTMIERLQLEQQQITGVYANFFDHSASQIQRVFRGHLGRRIIRQTIALKAAIRIQRAYRIIRQRRIERRRKLCILCRKILRGLRGIREKHELSHKELLSRVNHNMMIETQWRMAMGVDDSENSLLNAFYRKKFMRRRIGATFWQIFLMNSIVRYWHQLVPVSSPPQDLEEYESDKVSDTVDILEDAETTDMQEEAIVAPVEHLDDLSVGYQQVLTPVQTIKHHPNKKAFEKSTINREELRQRQLMYTLRIREEHGKREAARASALGKQRANARHAEEERARLEDVQQQWRKLHAEALREDMERRALAATKEIQSKKEEELRREQEAAERLQRARQKIVAEVLSDETQHILIRKERQKKGKKTNEHNFNKI